MRTECAGTGTLAPFSMDMLSPIAPGGARTFLPANLTRDRPPGTYPRRGPGRRCRPRAGWG
ncbi:hypothetical protein GCM10022284_30740 [Streptomyces hundungensis]